MSTDAVLALRNEIIDLAEIFAEAVVKKMQPVKDELTRRQAQKEFGAVWLKNQEKRDRIKGNRRGAHENSPIVYSRIELLALKEAEKRGAHMVRRINKT